MEYKNEYVKVMLVSAQTEMKRCLDFRGFWESCHGWDRNLTITGTAASTLAGPAPDYFGLDFSAVCVGMSLFSLLSLPHVTHRLWLSLCLGSILMGGWLTILL